MRSFFPLPLPLSRSRSQSLSHSRSNRNHRHHPQNKVDRDHIITITSNSTLDTTPSFSTSTSTSSQTPTPIATPLTTPIRPSTLFHTPNSSASSYEFLPTPSTACSLSTNTAITTGTSAGAGVGASKARVYRKFSLTTPFSSFTSEPITADGDKMGQNNGRMEHLDDSSSFPTGPDPSLFRSQPPLPPGVTPSQVPEFHHAPHSAPVIATAPQKQKVLTRALSARRRGEAVRTELAPSTAAPRKALKTLGQDLKADMKQFEALVIAAESASISTQALPTDNAHLPLQSGPGGTTKASAFFPQLNNISSANTSSIPSSQDKPISSHRRSSASVTSTPSRAGSVKSARRAEREWRAKVAAMSSTFDRRSPNNTDTVITEMRGPVPPRRTPAMTRIIAQSSTPLPQSFSACGTDAANSASPAKSFISNKSFETLGHYAHLTSDHVHDDLRSRKPSVSHSAVSSFYADKNGTRPSSMAAPQLLTIPPSSPLALQIPPPGAGADLTEASSQDSVPTPTTPHKAFLPPFESFQYSPRLVGHRMLPDLSAPSLHEAENRSSSSRRSTSDLRVRSIHSVKADKFLSLPSRPKPEHISLTCDPDGLRDFKFRTACPPPPSSPVMSTTKSTSALDTSATIQTPVRTLTRPDEPTTPSSPYSPTTAYILSAPSIENLAWSGDFSFDLSSSPLFASASGSSSRPRRPPSRDTDTEVPSTPVHPFAAFKGNPGSPEPPTPPSKSPIPRRTPSVGINSIAPKRSPSTSVMPPLGSPSDPFAHVIPGSSAKPSFMAKTASHSSSTGASRSKALPSPLALRLKQHPNTSTTSQPQRNHKMEIIGSASSRRGLRAAKGVDLTPGMESGHRPPKSGLPTADLQRWLADSSVST